MLAAALIKQRLFLLINVATVISTLQLMTLISMPNTTKIHGFLCSLAEHQRDCCALFLPQLMHCMDFGLSFPLFCVQDCIPRIVFGHCW